MSHFALYLASSGNAFDSATQHPTKPAVQSAHAGNPLPRLR